MLPDRVSNPGPPIYESGGLPTVQRKNINLILALVKKYDIFSLQTISLLSASDMH